MTALFMVDLEGLSLQDDEKELLQHPAVGAVLLFARNYKNRQQLCELTNSIHALNPDLFIAVDQEGGTVARFQRDGFRAIPAMRVLGELYDEDASVAKKMATYYGFVMASDLLACNVTLCMAPVLDLHGPSRVIGGLDRAFHVNPVVVAELGAAFIRGMREAGLPSVGKHFPGHGACDGDSHLEKPVSDATLDQMEQADLVPFKVLIQQKLLDAVMPAHVTYPQVDAQFAAGFSSTWLHGVLRKRLGFDGLIISDCISMTGADVGDLNTRAQLAFDAGCDMVIVSNQSRVRLLALLDSFRGKQSLDNSFWLSFKKKLPDFQIHPPKDALSAPGVEQSTSLTTDSINTTTSV